MRVIDLTNVPGKLTIDDGEKLAQLARGKVVLQLGGYCGKGTVTLAAVAKHVYLIDDFLSYHGDRATIMYQIGQQVKDAGLDGKVDLIFGDTSDPNLAAPLPAFDMAYIDADRDTSLIFQDISFVRDALKGDSMLVFHEAGKLITQPIEAGYLATMEVTQ